MPCSCRPWARETDRRGVVMTMRYEDDATQPAEATRLLPARTELVRLLVGHPRTSVSAPYALRAGFARCRGRRVIRAARAARRAIFARRYDHHPPSGRERPISSGSTGPRNRSPSDSCAIRGPRRCSPPSSPRPTCPSEPRPDSGRASDSIRPQLRARNPRLITCAHIRLMATSFPIAISRPTNLLVQPRAGLSEMHWHAGRPGPQGVFGLRYSPRHDGPIQNFLGADRRLAFSGRGSPCRSLAIYHALPADWMNKSLTCIRLMGAVTPSRCGLHHPTIGPLCDYCLARMANRFLFSIQNQTESARISCTQRLIVRRRGGSALHSTIPAVRNPRAGCDHRDRFRSHPATPWQHDWRRRRIAMAAPTHGGSCRAHAKRSVDGETRRASPASPPGACRRTGPALPVPALDGAWRGLRREFRG